jgi:lipopolysaccharide transport system ATP-binding protein
VLISILDVNRTAVFLLDSAVHGGLPEELPAEGSLVCETAPLMITPGRCYVNVRIVRQGVLADLVTNAAVLDIVDDDPLGLGEMPVRAWALNIVDQTWRHGRDEDASAGGAAVADVRA